MKLYDAARGLRTGGSDGDWSCNILNRIRNAAAAKLQPQKAEENFPNSLDPFLFFFLSFGAVGVPERPNVTGTICQEPRADPLESASKSRRSPWQNQRGGETSGRPPVSRSSPRMPPFLPAAAGGKHNNNAKTRPRARARHGRVCPNV